MYHFWMGEGVTVGLQLCCENRPPESREAPPGGGVPYLMIFAGTTPVCLSYLPLRSL